MSNEKVLERVRRLLALADHPNTPEHERSLALSQANLMMSKNAIDEAVARQGESQGATARGIVVRELNLFPDRNKVRDLYYALRSIFEHVASSNRIRLAYTAKGTVNAYGTESDISWAEMLFTTLQLEMISVMNPSWSSSKGYDENVYRLKVAGNTWKDIDFIAMSNGEASGRYIDKDGYYTDKFHSLLRAYKRHAKKIGQETLVGSSSPRSYRSQFIDSFTGRIIVRLFEMSNDAKKDADSIPGAALALRDTADLVNERFYEDFPSMDPERQKEARRQREQEHQDFLDSLTPKQRERYEEKEHRIRQKQERAYFKQLRAQDYAAHALGREAANKVSLTRDGRVSSVNNKQLG